MSITCSTRQPSSLVSQPTLPLLSYSYHNRKCPDTPQESSSQWNTACLRLLERCLRLSPIPLTSCNWWWPSLAFVFWLAPRWQRTEISLIPLQNLQTISPAIFPYGKSCPSPYTNHYCRTCNPSTATRLTWMSTSNQWLRSADRCCEMENLKLEASAITCRNSLNSNILMAKLSPTKKSLMVSS